MDTLFQVFCECAELNPDPHDGWYYFPHRMRSVFFLLHLFELFCVDFVLLEEEGEEHNWIFSADQMEDEEEAGMSDWGP